MSGAERNRAIVAGWAHDLVAAMDFLTRLPASRLLSPFAGQAGRRSLADIAWAFPAVGLIVGGLAAATFMAAYYLHLQPLVSALIALAVAIAATGALHEDGLADMADGFGGGKGKEAKLRIMRDSAVGSYGVLALIFSVGLRAAALAGMPDAGAAAISLIVAACVSRALIVGVMVALPPARSDGLGAGAGRPQTETALTALAIAVVVAFVLSGGLAWILLVVGGLATAFIMWLAKGQIGGHTGDVLGATQQAAEIAILLAAAAALG